MNVWDRECPALTLLIYYEIEFSPLHISKVGLVVMFSIYHFLIHHKQGVIITNGNSLTLGQRAKADDKLNIIKAVIKLTKPIIVSQICNRMSPDFETATLS